MVSDTKAYKMYVHGGYLQGHCIKQAGAAVAIGELETRCAAACVLSRQSIRYVPEPEHKLHNTEDHRSGSRELPCHSMFEVRRARLCKFCLGGLLYMDK